MKQLIAAGFIYFLSISFAGAQSFQNNFQTYAKNDKEERIYLHYDKSSYAPGETVWFKEYMMETNLPANKSKNIYIDWTDEKGRLLFHTMGLVIDGTSYGQFKIPENYQGQWIHVKAYTRWMLNFDSTFLYNKDLRILTGSRDSVSKNQIKPELSFFPEGGELIAGVNNKVAFKANDQYGRSVKINGEIRNDSGEVIDQLKVVHDGMGFFYILPGESEKLVAYWQDEMGGQHKTELPEAIKSGVSLQVAVAGSRRNFLVTVSPYLIAQLSAVHILGTEYHQPVFDITKEINKGLAGGVIETQNLPTGILTITVFDNEWKPVAERITFINNGEYDFHPSLIVKKLGLQKHGKNEFEVEVPDSLYANLSIAVTDGAIGDDNSNNIISDLLLTGELRGKVNDPVYYFQNDSDSLMQQLDLVLLTNGWRRINWQKLVAGEFPEIKYPRDTSYLSVAGKISGATPRQLKSFRNITLIVNSRDSRKQLFTLPLKSDGSFNGPSLVLFDTAEIYYQLASYELSNVKVEFAKEKPLPLSNSKASGIYLNHAADSSGNDYQTNLNDSVQNQIKRFKGKVLATVKLKPRLAIDKMDEKYTKGPFSGFDAKQIDVQDDPFAKTSTDVFQYLQGKVAGLRVDFDGYPPRFLWHGDGVGIFLNEQPATRDELITIPLSDVAYIKYFWPPFVLSRAQGGVIAVYTRKGTDIKGLSNNTVSGYTLTREFYSPDYQSISEENDKKDLRTTLYWNPNVITSPGKSKVLLSFFNNDITRSFRVIIEGMTKDGKLAHLEQLIQ